MVAHVWQDAVNTVSSVAAQPHRKDLPPLRQALLRHVLDRLVQLHRQSLLGVRSLRAVHCGSPVGDHGDLDVVGLLKVVLEFLQGQGALDVNLVPLGEL